MSARRRFGAVVAAALAALAVGAGATARPVGAAPSCHCFRDREYDAARPEASDPYLLATSANSLLAAVSGIDKREIVEARMSGTPGDDLWVAAHAARRRGADPRALLRERSDGGAWRELLGRAGDPEALGPRFVAALAAGAPDADLARVAAAEALAERVGTPRDELEELVRRGATLQELVVASLLGRWAGKAPTQVYEAARAGAGWSRQLAALGIAPKQVEERLAATLLPDPRGSSRNEPGGALREGTSPSPDAGPQAPR